MANHPTPITEQATVGQWLEHPLGGPALLALLARSGRDAEAMAPARNLPLGQLVQFSGGMLDAEVLADLVARANAGTAETGTADAADAAEGTEGGTSPGPWIERVVPGRFEGRTVVVTGAASGIGRATASRVAREGGRVLAVDLSADGLDRLAVDLDGHAVVPLVCDITDPAAVARVVEAADGRIDALANVAGVADDMTPQHEVSDSVWRRVFAVNVDGTFVMGRAVLPLMLAAGTGAVVNVASEAGLRGGAAGAAYTAAKHAVVGLTLNAAFMYGAHGIRVNAVAPGPVLTGMQPTYASDLGRDRLARARGILPEVVLPAQLAASVTFLLSDDATNLNGVVMPADGGWSAA